MKRLFKFSLVLLILIVLAAATAPFLIPAGKVKDAVLAQIIRASGRKVRIETLSFSLFPDIGFTAKNVVVPEPDWASSEDMMHIASVHLGVELMPLLQMHPQIRVKDLKLEAPVIRLVKRGAKANWQFAAPSQQPQVANAAANAVSNPSHGAGEVSADALSLDKITIKNGSLTYDDGSAAPKTVTGLNVAVEAPHLNEKILFDGSATYNGQTAAVTCTIGKPLSLPSGKPVNIDLSLKSSGLNVQWQGTLAFSGPLPRLTGTVNIPELNAADISSGPQNTPISAASVSTATASAAPPAGRWSDAPIHVEALGSLNADLQLTINTLVLPQTSLSNVAAHIVIRSGALSVTVPKLAAYNGTLSASLSMNTGYKAAFSMAVADVKAEPLLHDFAKFDKLSGTLGAHVNINTQGKSERQMVSALAGSGDFHFKDGKYTGANLVSLIRSAGTASNSANQTTDFSDLSGSYTINTGIVTNNDLKLTSQLLHVGGAGTVDLPAWMVHYLLTPQIVGAAQSGQAPGGIIVPVHMDGPLDNPKFKADLQAALTENLKDPKALKSNLKAIRQNLLGNNPDAKSSLKNLLKGF